MCNINCLCDLIFYSDIQYINDQGIAIKEHKYIYVYYNVPNTCFGRFLTGHHKVGIQCRRNYVRILNIVINVSVNTENGEDEISFTKNRACVQTGRGNTCIVTP